MVTHFIIVRNWERYYKLSFVLKIVKNISLKKNTVNAGLKAMFGKYLLPNVVALNVVQLKNVYIWWCALNPILCATNSGLD